MPKKVRSARGDVAILSSLGLYTCPDIVGFKNKVTIDIDSFNILCFNFSKHRRTNFPFVKGATYFWTFETIGKPDYDFQHNEGIFSDLSTACSKAKLMVDEYKKICREKPTEIELCSGKSGLSV